MKSQTRGDDLEFWKDVWDSYNVSYTENAFGKSMVQILAVVTGDWRKGKGDFMYEHARENWRALQDITSTSGGGDKLRTLVAEANHTRCVMIFYELMTRVMGYKICKVTIILVDNYYLASVDI